MKQKPIELWYGKKEPITQIEILKSIAINGYQSKTILTNNLHSKITTIDTIVGKMNDYNHGLIQIHRKEQQENKKAFHIMFSLTEKGIKILVENKFQDSDKPYLEPKELVIFLNNFKRDYIDKFKEVKEIKTELISGWTPPKLNEKNILDMYIDSNPQYKIALGNELSKYNSKLGGLVNKIKEAKAKLEMLENELPSMIHESIENSKK